MARPLVTLALGMLTFLGPACGRKAPLELPPGRGPMAVERLSAVQRGAGVILQWTNPVKTVSGRPLAAVEAAEIWTLDPGSSAEGRTSGASDVERRGRLVRRLSKEEIARSPTDADRGGPVEVAVELGAAHPARRAAFAVRVVDAKGRRSEFSPPAVLELRVAPEPPRSAGLRVLAEAVELRWAAPEANVDGSRPAAVAGYAVYRSDGGGPWRARTPAPVSVTAFEDRDFEFGRAYAYVVRAVAAGPGAGVESGDSEILRTVPKDVFPPAPPAGLSVVAGDGLAALNWRRGDEPDLDGYRVWRKPAGEEAFTALGGGIVRDVVFVDRGVERERAYVYAVSAVDRTGNESPKAESGRVVIKKERP